MRVRGKQLAGEPARSPRTPVIRRPARTRDTWSSRGLCCQLNGDGTIQLGLVHCLGVSQQHLCPIFYFLRASRIVCDTFRRAWNNKSFKLTKPIGPALFFERLLNAQNLLLISTSKTSFAHDLPAMYFCRIHIYIL
jgi:hypothetical protein